MRRSAAVAGLLLIGCAAFLLFRATHPAPVPPPPTIPNAIRQKVHIPLYYPTTLPAGLSVDGNSFKVPAKDVVVFVVKSAKGNIAVSEQARPPATQFDINNFYTTKVNNPNAFLTSVGQATIGQLVDGRQFGSLVADQTWIIAVAPAQVNSEDLRAVISALQPLAGG
jgi:hypothetical protein